MALHSASAAQQNVVKSFIGSPCEVNCASGVLQLPHGDTTHGAPLLPCGVGLTKLDNWRCGHGARAHSASPNPVWSFGASVRFCRVPRYRSVVCTLACPSSIWI